MNYTLQEPVRWLVVPLKPMWQRVFTHPCEWIPLSPSLPSSSSCHTWAIFPLFIQTCEQPVDRHVGKTDRNTTELNCYFIILLSLLSSWLSWAMWCSVLAWLRDNDWRDKRVVLIESCIMHDEPPPPSARCVDTMMLHDPVIFHRVGMIVIIACIVRLTWFGCDWLETTGVHESGRRDCVGEW